MLVLVCGRRIGVCLSLPLLAVMRRGGSLGWQLARVAAVGRHPLMAADKRGVPRATGVRAGRIGGLSRWGLIYHPLPSHLPTCGFNAHNEDGGETRSSSPTKEERLLHQKCSLISGQLRERDPSLTFRGFLMTRDWKVRFQMSGVELHSRDAADSGEEDNMNG